MTIPFAGGPIMKPLHVAAVKPRGHATECAKTFTGAACKENGDIAMTDAEIIRHVAEMLSPMAFEDGWYFNLPEAEQSRHESITFAVEAFEFIKAQLEERAK